MVALVDHRKAVLSAIQVVFSWAHQTSLTLNCKDRLSFDKGW